MNDPHDKKIEVLLSEYHACHRTRDAYARIRWSMGSIFLATSMGLVGISFSYEKIEILYGMAIPSLVFLLIWILYCHNISVYTMTSIYRMHEIEVELRKQFDIKLHKLIRETPTLRGLHITTLFYGTIFWAWWIRFVIFGLSTQWHWSLYAISIIIFLPLVIVLLWLKRKFPNYILKINSLLLEEKKAKEQEIFQG